MKWLAHGEVLDAGYQEILVRSSFADELLAGGMRFVNEVPVDVWQVDAFPAWDAVLLRVRPVYAGDQAHVFVEDRRLVA